jgi:ribosomal protein S18 acetylase RimI-like enzyme
MEFKYFKTLKNEPELRTRLDEFLEHEQLEAYFRPDEDKELEGLYNNYIVCNNVGEVFAYAEPLGYNEEKACTDFAFASAENEWGDKACTLLLQKLAERVNRCCVSTFEAGDERLTKAGFVPFYDDYLMLRDRWIPKTSKGIVFDEAGSAENGRYDIFVVTADEEVDEVEYIVTDNELLDAEGLPQQVSGCKITLYSDQICLSEVWTDEAHRRKGLAAGLINFCIDEYSDKSIILHTDSQNVAAVELYKKLGFGIYETSYNYISLSEKSL